MQKLPTDLLVVPIESWVLDKNRIKQSKRARSMRETPPASAAVNHTPLEPAPVWTLRTRLLFYRCLQRTKREICTKGSHTFNTAVSYYHINVRVYYHTTVVYRPNLTLQKIVYIVLCYRHIQWIFLL